MICAGLLLVSCGGGGSDSSGGGGSCSLLNAKVFNGDTCDQTAKTPVVALFPVGDDGTQLFIAGVCTGTLVTLDDIVTSAHCFADPIQELGRTIVGFVAVVGGEDGEAIAITNYALHPLYDGRAASPYDVAVATLRQVPSPAIGPLPIAQSEATLVGDTLTTFGYGTSNKGEIGILKAADIEIEATEGGNLFGTLATSGASICQGDSGGPAIKRIGGVASLAGVNSIGSADIEECAASGAEFFGFVDIQNASILDFISNYAPDIAVQ